MATCKTCGYNSGKKNHSCALQLRRKLRSELSEIREFIASQDIDCFGAGHNFEGQTWPIRDEFIDSLTKKINSYK